MRIVYLAAGAAGMYCGSCLHDNTLAAALKEQGSDIWLVPTYTPLRTDETDVSQRRVFYGGINVYLQQKSALFRHTPRFIDRLFDSPTLLDWVSRRGISTDPADLGDMTVSMLEGEVGRQRKELTKLVDWLANEARPAVVHLSNSMLIGMARDIRRRVGCPIVASLSGEDIFLEKLPEPHYSAARQLLRERAREVDRFVALNNYYARFMAGYLGVESERVVVIPHGLNLAGHGREAAPPARDEVTIGYFARVCPDKGLHLLIEAFLLLAEDQSLPPLRLKAAGYLGAGDRAYLRELERRILSSRLSDRFEYAGELDRQQKIDFLQSLDVMSVPTVYRESKGLSILEAMANGVPVVLPEHGTFPEMIADTGGGLLFEPHCPHDLATKLRQLILDRSTREQLGQRAQQAVHERYHHRAMATAHVDLYSQLVSRPVAPSADLIASSHSPTTR